MPWTAEAGGTTLDAPAPASIVRDYAGTVTLHVTGVVGSAVELRLYVDVDGDGVKDAGDEVVWLDVVEDNLAEWSPNQFSDADPAAGVIDVDVRLFSLLDFPYVAGTYLWEAADTGDGTSNLQPFMVTQTGTQSVSDTIRDEDTLQPIPGALAVLEPYCDLGDEAYRFYAAWADENGDYSISVPADLDCNYRSLLAFRFGYQTFPLSGPQLVFDGTSTFPGMDLTLQPGDHAVTGQIQYADGPRAGQGIPGVFVEAESEGFPTFSGALTDESGNYTLSLDDGDWRIVGTGDEAMTRGLVAIEGDEEFVTVDGGGVAVPTIQHPTANAYFQGTLYDDTGTPVGGRWIEAYRTYPCYPDCIEALALTAPDGTFTLGVTGPAGPETYGYTIGVQGPMTGLVVERRECDAISAGETQTGKDLHHLTPTSFITGTVHDKDGDPLGNLCLEADSYVGCTSYSALAFTACDGTYSMPALDGLWNVHGEVWDDAAVRRNLDETRVQRDVTVAGENVSGVSFLLGPWLQGPAIDGIEQGTGPAGTHFLVEGRGFSFSGAPPEVWVDGTVPAPLVVSRSDLGVLVAAIPSGLSAGPHQVTVVNTDAGLTSNPGCIEVTAGTFAAACTITGTLSDPGLAAVEGAIVAAVSSDGESFRRVAVSDGAGSYALELDATGDYALFLLPPEGMPWINGQYVPVACGNSQDHTFATGWEVTGRLIGDFDGVVNARVEASRENGPDYSTFGLTDEEGAFTLYVPGGDYRFDYAPPRGSRFIEPSPVSQTISSDTNLADAEAPPGALVWGSAVGADGGGVAARVRAYRASDDLYSGATQTDQCTGGFDLPVPDGQTYRLEIEPEGPSVPGPTEVKVIDVDGDTVTDFPFPVSDGASLQHTGPEPRVKDVAARGQEGQPLRIEAENLGGGALDVLFSDGVGGFVAGTDTIGDVARGSILTRIPAGAATGSLKLSVGGLEGPEVSFELLPGSFDTGTHTVSGTIRDGSMTPVPFAVAVLLWNDPNATDCDDDGFIQDYALADGSGDYGPLTHPGGDILLYFRPTGGEPLTVSVEAANSVFVNTIIDGTLPAGIPVDLRVVDDAMTPQPVPSALVEYVHEGLESFDLTLTDANGEARLWVPAGDLFFGVAPPTGSRLLESGFIDTVGGAVDYGDVPLARGVFVSARLTRESDGSPLPLGFGFLSDADTFQSLSEGNADTNGVLRLVSAGNRTTLLEVDTPHDDVSQLEVGGIEVGQNDCVLYPALALGAAGIVEGTVTDAMTLAPLSDIEVHNHVDESGSPGSLGPAFRSSCPNGAYRLKLPVGTHFLHINAPFEGKNTAYAEEWYQDALCVENAVGLVVGEGETLHADIALDPVGSISGSVVVNGAPTSGVSVCASLGGLEASCELCTLTGEGGDYSLDLPAGTGYRVEATTAAGAECFDAFEGCADFTPVSVLGGLDTPSVDFETGFDPAGGGNQPAVALCDGVAHYAWSRLDGDNADIRYRSCVVGGACAAARTLVAAPTRERRPAVQCAGSTVIVLWEDTRNGNADVAYRRSVDGGASFGALAFLVQGPSEETHPQLAMSGSTVLAVWEDGRNGNQDLGMRRSTDGGQTWGGFTFLVRSPFDDSDPALTLSGSDALLAWVDRRHGNQDIAYRRSADGGATWMPLTFLVSAAQDESDPTVAADGTVQLIGWVDRRWGNEDLAFRRSSDGGATFATLTFLVRAPTDDSQMVLRLDGSDGLMSWVDTRSVNRNLSFRHSADAGLSWGGAARLVAAPTDELEPACALVSGDAACVWTDTRTGQPFPHARQSVDGGQSWGVRFEVDGP